MRVLILGTDSVRIESCVETKRGRRFPVFGAGGTSESI
jgi:hypothetical protein